MFRSWNRVWTWPSPHSNVLGKLILLCLSMIWKYNLSFCLNSLNVLLRMEEFYFSLILSSNKVFSPLIQRYEKFNWLIFRWRYQIFQCIICWSKVYLWCNDNWCSKLRRLDTMCIHSIYVWDSKKLILW